MADEVEGFVPHRRYPSALGWAGFERGHCVHDILPRPFGHDGVAVLQVSLGDLQVDGGLAHGLILGLDEPREASSFVVLLLARLPVTLSKQ